jgi:gluconokinase
MSVPEKGPLLPSPPVRAVVIIGPSGSGKTTLGRALAASIGCPFIEGDDFHPPQNRRKIAGGTPLDEADRAPFLNGIGDALAEAEGPVVASCSALRRTHRARLCAAAEDILFVWLDVPSSELRERLQQRRGHFMPAELLGDQLATFEPPTPPEQSVRIDGTRSTSDQVEMITRMLAELQSAKPR